jgi:hypothetical protein
MTLIVEQVAEGEVLVFEKQLDLEVGWGGGQHRDLKQQLKGLNQFQLRVVSNYFAISL